MLVYTVYTILYQTGLSETEVFDNQKKLFSSVPEYGVKDMVRWFLFVIRVRPKLLHGLQVYKYIPSYINYSSYPHALSLFSPSLSFSPLSLSPLSLSPLSLSPLSLPSLSPISLSLSPLSLCSLSPPPLSSPQLTPAIDCCISLLERPDLLPGPVAQSRIVTLLLACIGRDASTQQQ